MRFPAMRLLQARPLLLPSGAIRKTTPAMSFEFSTIVWVCRFPLLTRARPRVAGQRPQAGWLRKRRRIVSVLAGWYPGYDAIRSHVRGSDCRVASLLAMTVGAMTVGAMT